MNKSVAVAAMAFALLAGGCATSYQSSEESLKGGFSEIRLTANSWRIVVEGNGFTSRGTADQFLMRRSAELTLERGKRYFVFSEHDAWQRAIRTSRRNVVIAPIDQAVVSAVDSEERDAFDAVQIIAETNKIADGRLSVAARKALEAFEGAGR